MGKLISEVRGAGLGGGRGDWRVDKYKVEDMLKFFDKAFWVDPVMSLWWFDFKLVNTVKENEKLIKELLKSELERDYRDSLNKNIDFWNIERFIEWMEVIINNNPKDFWIIGKQFLHCRDTINGLISFLKLYKSANSNREDPTFREEWEIILILIIKTLKVSGRNMPRFWWVKWELFSKIEEEMKYLTNNSDIEIDTKIQLIFQSSSASYGNAPTTNHWKEDFIRALSGEGKTVLVHFIKRSQINKEEVLFYLEKNILEVVVEYWNNYIFILKNDREWKKEEILLYKTNENQLQNKVERGEIEKIINFFLIWTVPYNSIEDFKVIRKSKISSQSMLAESEFYTSLQTISYQGV